MRMAVCLRRRKCGGRTHCRVAVQRDRKIRLRYEIASAVRHRWHSDLNVFGALEPDSTSCARSREDRVDSE